MSEPVNVQTPGITVSDAAKTILEDCIWENAAETILQHNASNTTATGSLELRDWLNVIKATGGVIGIGWYNHNVNTITQYTFFNPITDSNNGLHTVTVLGDVVSDERSPPVYTVAGHQSIREKLRDNRITATCVTVNEIRKSIPVSKRETFPLQLAPDRSLNLFQHSYSRERHWNSILRYIPVTKAAGDVIRCLPWQYPRDRFLAYQSANDPESVIPNADKWVKLLKCSGGQVILAWFDPNKNAIDQITYYDTHDVDDGTGTMDFRFFKPNKEMSGKESKYVIKETLNDSRLLPTVMSIHSLDLTEFKR